MTPLLAVENLSKSFGGLKAVADVSLAVTPGEICSVIGPNGAGKTTLFNMISGVLRPSTGRIVFDGTDLADVSPWRFAAKGIGRTFQNLALFKHGTVVENILTGRHTQLRSSALFAVLFFVRPRCEASDARRGGGGGRPGREGALPGRRRYGVREGGGGGMPALAARRAGPPRIQANPARAASAADAGSLRTALQDGAIPIPQLLRRRAELHGDQLALREKEYGIWNRYSWNHYYETARSVALGLMSLAVKPGDRV